MTNRAILLIVGALSSAACAGIFGEPKSPERVRFECEAKALAPYMKDVLDAEALLRDAYAGKANLNQALQSMHATAAQVSAAKDAFDACSKPELPAGAPS